MKTLLFIFLSFVAAESNGRGWNDNIDWKTWDEGLALAKSTNKPAMLVIHKTWCGACKSLKPKFAESKEIEAESQNFIMINLQDDEEPKDASFAPDGGYIPRIIYVSPDGIPRPDIFNKNRPDQYKYFYSSAEEVVQGMKAASLKLSGGHDHEL